MSYITNSFKHVGYGLSSYESCRNNDGRLPPITYP